MRLLAAAPIAVLLLSTSIPGALFGQAPAEAQAEVAAIATVLAPPVELSVEDLDFGEVTPGGDNTVAPDPEGTARGALTVENLSGSGQVWVRFRNPDSGGGIIQALRHVDIPGAVLPLVWTQDHAVGCWRNTNQPSAQRTCGDTWNPESDELVLTTPPGQGRPLTLEIYLGGEAAPTGDEPPGQYVGRIQVIIELVQ